MTVLALDNPITSIVGGAAEAGGKAVFGFVVNSLLGALANACSRVTQQLIAFLDRSSSVSFESGWWAGPRGQGLFANVLQLSAVLMMLFLLLAVAQGVLAGEPGQMVRAALVEAPLSVLGTVCLVAVTTVLLGLTDGASSLVLGDAPASLGRFASGFGKATFATSGLLAALMGVLFLLGALLVWVELAVRASLIYFLVLVGPIALAARVWPAARGAFRKLCELGVAIIVSKFAIALALALGAAALGGGGPARPGASLGEQTGQDLSGLLVGTTLMLLAAFTPFVVMRLVPIVETATLAHGISRSPLRGAMAGAQGVYYGQGLMRMAGGGTGRSAGVMASTGGAAAAGAAPVAAAAAPVAAGVAVAKTSVDAVSSRAAAQTQRPVGAVAPEREGGQ